MVLNTKRLKEINVDLVKTALKFEDFSTKNSISIATGLSVATCRNILDELMKSGEVKEIELGASTGGRPSRRFVYNQNYAYVAILYTRIEGDERSIYCSVVNMLGAQIHEEYFRFDDISVKEIDEVLIIITDLYPRIQVFSLGIPGVVRNGVVGICDFEKLCHLPLREYLMEKFNRIVTIENDVNSASLGYYHKMINDNPESLVYLYYPQNGIAGAGIIVNGRVINGQSNFAGEVSYMPLGADREQQGLLQNEPDKFVQFVAKTVLAVNSLLNPARVVFSGQWFTEDLMEQIQKILTEKTPQGHIPELSYELDIHDSYIDGLKFSGIYKLSCGFEIIQK